MAEMPAGASVGSVAVSGASSVLTATATAGAAATDAVSDAADAGVINCSVGRRWSWIASGPSGWVLAGKAAVAVVGGRC